MRNQTYAQALAAVNAGQFAQRASWAPSSYIGLKNAQVWLSGASASGQAYTPSDEDRSAVDWVTLDDVRQIASSAAQYPVHNDPRASKPGALPDIPGHLVVQFPTDPVAATNALNA